MTALLIAAPVLPLLATPLILLVGRRFPWQGGELMVGATALSLAALLSLYGTQQTVQGTWFESGGFHLTVGLELDRLTWFAAVVVAGVSLFVGLYSIGYMASEPDRPRFFAELAAFVGAMLTLVLSSSLILLFAAWEAVGILSYLLIGFRREDGARRAAAKALLMTRLGDMGLLLGWLLVLLQLRTTDIASLLAAVSNGWFSEGMLTAVALLLFLGAIGKSAQLPLTAWLPDAMVAPTPVSALIHSATMVAAGVYLLLRLYPLFAAAPGVLAAVFWVGAATALFSAVVATGELDLKRVLAWSTSSHLGTMMLAVGLGGPLAAALQFVVHASFKSALFLAAGIVDKNARTRDLRRLGGLGHVLPVTTLAFVLGALSLTGFQPFFFTSSDDVIVATALGVAPGAAYLILAVIFLGGVYIARAGIAAFGGDKPDSRPGPDERSLPMLIGLMALASAAVLGTLIVEAAPPVLPFGPTPETPWTWRVIVLAAGAAGLVLGGGHAWRHHAASALGGLPDVLARGLATATELPSRLAFTTARAVARIERGFDAMARNAATVVWLLAVGSDRLERQDFGAGGDRFAQALQWAGEELRPLESGSLYLYTLGLFAWSLAVVVAGGLVFGL